MGAAPQRQAGRNLVVVVRDALKALIEAGQYRPGDRLPSEAKLTQEYGVSRTVVREAIAALRADNLVEARQGAGVFVLEPPEAVDLPFQNIDYVRISSMIEMLELRTAVETEAAALAALRRSPAQEERIVKAFREIGRLAAEGQQTTDADFDLHLAIAEATANPRFAEFLAMVGPSVIPRRALQQTGAERAPGAYLKVLNDEHERIVNAILEGDEDRARDAMRQHLKGSLSRYRALLRQPSEGGAA